MLRLVGQDESVDSVPVEVALSSVHPEDREEFERRLKQALKQTGQDSLEYRLVRPGGDTIYIHTEFRVQVNESGEVTSVTGTSQDITERKLIENEIETIYNTSVDLMCVADLPTMTFKRVNPAFTEVLGYSEDELLSRSFMEFVHPDDIESTRAIASEKLEKGEDIICFENRYLTKDGNHVWLEWTSRPYPERGLSFAIAHHVTERKEREEQLRSSEQRFRSYIDNAPNGIFLVR
jgi:PAS domain S-box-containing protein